MFGSVLAKYFIITYILILAVLMFGPVSKPLCGDPKRQQHFEGSVGPVLTKQEIAWSRIGLTLFGDAQPSAELWDNFRNDPAQREKMVEVIAEHLHDSFGYRHSYFSGSHVSQEERDQALLIAVHHLIGEYDMQRGPLPHFISACLRNRIIDVLRQGQSVNALHLSARNEADSTALAKLQLPESNAASISYIKSNGLNDRERYVASEYFFFRKTSSEIAGDLGVSDERVLQMCRKVRKEWQTAQLKRVSRPAQEIGTLHFLVGLSVSEIALKFGLSEKRIEWVLGQIVDGAEEISVNTNAREAARAAVQQVPILQKGAI